MKVVGLITEYNPFHNGHKYHIEEARRITGADYVVAVMSGDFVQRGVPAIIDKYSRTRMALNNGVDLVLELPVCYATGSAEYFAHGAVAVLNALGVVDYLCFGSEAGEIELLQKATELIYSAPASFDDLLKAYLKEGLNYPAARQKALEAVTGSLSPDNNRPDDNNALIKVFTEPNNILGIEYLKAIHDLSASMQPVTIRREVAHYHEATLTRIDTPSVISSATAIRSTINTIDGSI
jgi:predicted nucleotidyltransferase